MLILLLVLATATAIVLVRTIASDGYGTRLAPRSHRDQSGRPHVLD